jgi:uncharacterized protein (TIGR02147 family)
MKNPILQRLQEVLQEKAQKNPSFGLRALARQLKIPAPTLSRILTGKRGLSIHMARRIVQGLTDHPVEQRRLLKAYALEPKRAPTQATRYRYLELAELEVLSHWGHGALLEVLRGEVGIRSLLTLATATGLSEPEVERCLKDMQRLSLVSYSIKRGWHSKGVHLSSIRWEGEGAWKKIHRGYAEQGVRYFEKYNSNEANFQGITFLAPAGRVQEAKQRIREFAEELSDDLAGESGEVLYRLNVQLFPLGRKSAGGTGVSGV